MKGVLSLCWQTSQSFLKDIYNVFWSSPSLFLPLKLLSDLPQHVSLSTSYSHLFFLSAKSNWTWMWGYSPEHGQLTCGHSPKKNDSPSHRNYQLPITALVEVGLFSFALAAAGILTGLILSVQINTVVMYPGRRGPCHIQKTAPHRTLPIIWMYTCPNFCDVSWALKEHRQRYHI